MPPPPLPGPLAYLAPLLDDYGYLAVGLLVLLDNCGIPVPGQTVLVLAAVYAGTGRMSIAAVVAIAIAAAVVGDCLGYLIGRTGGHAFVHRWGRYVALTPARMARAEGFFERNGGKVVTVARFVDGLRQTNGIIAGTTGMAWRRFLPANIAGAVLWVGVWATLGYVLGTDIGTVYERALRYQVYLLAALGAVAGLMVLRALRRRRREQAAGPADGRHINGPGTDGPDTSARDTAGPGADGHRADGPAAGSPADGDPPPHGPGRGRSCGGGSDSSGSGGGQPSGMTSKGDA
ncbi:DedA family protein [Kitasatospora sp. NPDC051914]|uniref:DedA family protein n=1 Tax=Kitasatospora sp. NPDC051914 TaxID=3154945 RepID=UPI003441B463